MKRLDGQSINSATYEGSFIIKVFNSYHPYVNEVYFYEHFSEFCPKLIAKNDSDLTLVIEKCNPLNKTKKTIAQAISIIQLLRKLQAAGINHGDPVIGNIVIQGNKPLLIDWEYASLSPENAGKDLLDWHTEYEHGLGNYYADLDQTKIWKELEKLT